MTDSNNLKFTTSPTVFQNPNPTVPLAAVVQFSASNAVQTIVQLSDGNRQWEIKFDQNPEDGLPIVGMRADQTHELTISIVDGDGNVAQAPETLSYTTPPLPTDKTLFPPIRTTISKPDKMEPGFTITSIRRRRFGQLTDLSQDERNFLLFFGLLVALDAEGEVVWYHQQDVCFSDFIQLKNGNILYLTLDHHIIEIDMLGNVIASWRSSGSPFPARSDDVKVMGDEIIEFQRDGTIVWRWQAFDWLDPYRMGYESLYIYWLMHGFADFVDWTHGNTPSRCSVQNRP